MNSIPPDPSPITYPCDFPIKVMGPQVAGFVETIAGVIQQYDSGFDATSIEKRPSSKGNYLGLTVTVRATSRDQLDAIYRALTSHPMVKYVL
jgi:putative lipoic acid-binding regulatory protein